MRECFADSAGAEDARGTMGKGEIELSALPKRRSHASLCESFAMRGTSISALAGTP
jgi:hypothetical protein